MSEDLKVEKLKNHLAILTIFDSINKNRDTAATNITKIIDSLQREGYIKYIFNIEHLDYMNSHFIGIIASRHYSLREKGGTIVILNAPDIVKKSFDVTGLSDMVKFFASKDEAISEF